MGRILTQIVDPTRIQEIDGVIHDSWFNAEDIHFDAARCVLSIKFRREATDKGRMVEKDWLLKKWEIPVTECFLRFYNVKAYRIDDTERVGRYNLLELAYDPQAMRVIVKTGIPIHIEMIVECFEVEVEETDKILEVKTIRSLFDITKL